MTNSEMTIIDEATKPGHSEDIHPKVVKAVRLSRKNKNEKMSFEFIEKDRRRKGN
jgi:hypothetical protein